MAQGAGGSGPRYRLIADDLRRRIDSGEFADGGKLPSKDKLGLHYGAAVNTVERALSELRREGRIESVWGSGTYLRDPPPPAPGLADVIARLESAEEDIRRLGERLDGLEPVREHLERVLRRG